MVAFTISRRTFHQRWVLYWIYLQIRRKQTPELSFMHELQHTILGLKFLLFVAIKMYFYCFNIHFLGPTDYEIWMMSSTSRDHKYYPVNAIYHNLQLQVVNNLLAFHSFTGCDSAPSFSRFGKKSCWKVYYQQPML